jgi:hypothetical protein
VLEIIETEVNGSLICTLHCHKILPSSLPAEVRSERQEYDDISPAVCIHCSLANAVSRRLLPAMMGTRTEREPPGRREDDGSRPVNNDDATHLPPEFGIRRSLVVGVCTVYL